MASVGPLWGPAALRALRKAAGSATKLAQTFKAQLSTNTARPDVHTLLTGSRTRQPIHPSALLRRSKNPRWSSIYTSVDATLRRYISGTSARAATSSGAAPRLHRSQLPSSTVSRAVTQLTGRAPFASTLRPNLTGGTLPRTAGGYTLSGAGRAGGARYFSHTPAAPAQVVQNVSQAMRAFWLSGQRARFDGHGPNGETRYKAVTELQERTARKLASNRSRAAQYQPGSFIDFRLSPTITALSPLVAATAGLLTDSEEFDGLFQANATAMNGATLHAEGFLDVLSVDLARALKDYAAIMTDLQRLSVLGDLPVTLENHNALRVRFPGLDAESAERLCDDVGVRRGVVGQDPDFVEALEEKVVVAPSMALRIPYAPGLDDAVVEEELTSPGGSLRSRRSDAFDEEYESEDEEELFYRHHPGAAEQNPWLSATTSSLPYEEGYESLSPPIPSSPEHCSDDFEGLEGIYRFIEECDRARGRF